MSSNESKIGRLRELLDEASEAKCLWRFSAKNKVRGLYAADVNADGQIEVIVGTDENIVYLLNAKDGEPLWRFLTGGWVPTVHAASVQGGARAEIIAGSDDGFVYVLDANGQQLWRFGTTPRMRSVYAGDVDQDGEIEVLSASFNKHVYVFDGGGRLKNNFSTGELIFKLRTCDIDGDGQVEIVAATDSGKILIYDYGSESLAHEISCSGRVFALELADVDGDGCTEIIAGSFDNNLYAWNGQTLELKWKTDLRDRIYAIVITDIDQDGADEILVSTRNRYMHVLDSHGQLKWKIALEHWAFDTWIGDLDGDGQLELLTCSEMEDCVQLYRLPDTGELGNQIRQLYGQIEEPLSLDWNMSREQWELLALVLPDIELPERATEPGVCDRKLKLSKIQESLKSGEYRQAIRHGLELSTHRLDFAWDYDLKAELRSLAIYHDAPHPHSPLILCAPDHRSFLAIDNARQKVIEETVPFPARRIFATNLFPDRQTIVVGLNSGIYTYEYPQGIGEYFPSTDWIEDTHIGRLDDDERPSIFVASFDGRVYVWNSRMGIRWFYPNKNKKESVYAVCALDAAWQTQARVVIGSFDGAVEALDGSGTECVWRYDCQDRVFAIRAADFGTQGADPSRRLIIAGSDNGKVHALDVNGILRWQYHTGQAVKWIEIFDIDEDGLLEILISASDGRFYILDPEGDAKLECQLGSWVQGLQVADIDGDNRLEMCFGLRNRKKLFVYRFLRKEDLEDLVNKCLQAWQSQSDPKDVVEMLRADSDDLLRAYGTRIWLSSSPQPEQNQVKSILRDRSENVRMELALALPPLMEKIPHPALDWLENLACDPSWRIRQQLADDLASFYQASRMAAERCIHLLQSDENPRVRRKLVRSLVKMLQVGDWAYEKLLAMALRAEADEWVRHEVVRGLASFLDKHPNQAPELLQLRSSETLIVQALELLDRNRVAFHMLALTTNLQPNRFSESVTELARYTALRLDQGVDDKTSRVSLSEPVQIEGSIHAAVLQNVTPLLDDESYPEAATLTILFHQSRTLNTHDIRALLQRDSIGIFVSFEEKIPRQTQALLDSLSFNVRLAPWTYLEFLDLITAQHPRTELRGALKQSILGRTDPWAVSFIGRRRELQTIQNHLLAWQKRRIIFIQGDGGIGKTRLLNEIDRHFAAGDIDIPLMMLSIIDFDDDQHKSPRNVLVSLARQLDPQIFSPFLEAVREMHLIEEGVARGEATTSVQRKRFAVARHFIDCFNTVSREQRIVVRLDTTDALNDNTPIAYLIEIVSQLDNVLLLVAGRNAEILYKEYGKVLGEDAISLRLSRFTSSDSATYLAEKQNVLKVTLAQEWMAKLFVLASGLPVLIDLAIEWAQNNRPLNWMEELSLSDLEMLQKQAQSNKKAQEDLEKLQERFKQVVVTPIADLRDNQDHLKLVLSKVYPLDLEGIMEMLNLGQEDARRLFADVQQSVAIKRLPDGRIKLHDEVQRLVNRYVWPGFDRDGGREHRDSHRAIAYLTHKSEVILDKIRKLRQNEFDLAQTRDPSQVLEVFGERFGQEWTFEALRIERLRRQLAIDVLTGYGMFQKDYNLAEASWAYRQALLDQITPYVDWDSPRRDTQGNALSESERLKVQRTLARHATFAGLYDRAAELYQRLLEQVSPDSEEYIEILIGQANQLVRAGKLQEALSVNKEALNLATELGSSGWVMKSTLEIGWVYRLMGDLKETLKNYTTARKMAFDNDDEERMALICNNLAYVHALRGQDREALSEIRQANRLWQKLAREREEHRFRLGQCYNIAGEVHLELGRPEEALPFFELSWSIFDQEEITTEGQEARTAEWKSKSRSGRGFALHHLAATDLRRGDTDAAQRNLQEALDNLNWAVEHATETDSPSILNRRGEAHFLLKKYQAAEDDWQESLMEARQVGDAFTELNSLSNLARLALCHPVRRFATWQDFKRWYDNDYQQRYEARSQPLMGLYYTYLGHLALKEEEVESAVALYEQGLSILAQTGRRGPLNLTNQLDFIENEILPSLPSKTTRQLGEMLKRTWTVDAYDVLAKIYFREWSRWPEQGREVMENEHA